MIKIQREDIDIPKHIDMVRTPETGGIVTFLGTVRDNAEGRRVAKMSIEVYEAMAKSQLEA
jgi:molybdopterin synthase catalytic subunit